MKNFDIKKLLPHIVALIVFVLVAIIYCKPALEGKVLQQHDIQGWRGMAQQSIEVKEKTGHFPLWTNSMFSGMPAYQITMEAKTNIGVGLHYITKAFSLWLPEPINFFFLACLCFYILCMVAGADSWVSILGALAYAYSTYDPIILAVGHITKMASIAYAPMVIAGLLLLFKRKYLLGFAITTFFSSALIAQNHLQIVYYTLLTAGIMSVAYFIKSIKEKTVVPAAKALALGLIAGIIGLATTAVIMMPTYEYAKASMRGGVSQLSLEKDSTNNKTKGGLDKDYAFRWSYGIAETGTFLIPGLYGGSNGGNEYGSNSKFVEKLAEVGVPEENAIQMANGSSYWGPQPVTSGPVYLGAIICLLFIFGMFYINSWHKWWILAASIFGILLAWGSNFASFNYFLFDHLPFYNKFRAPSMSLVIPQLCFPLLGVLAVSKLIKETDFNYAWKKLKHTAIAAGIILAIGGCFYAMADFSGENDPRMKENFKQGLQQRVPPGQEVPPEVAQQAELTSKNLVNALKEDRKGLMGGDLLRSTFLIAMAFVLLTLFVRKKINALVLSIGLLILSSYDLIGIDKRYMNEENFKEAEELQGEFTPTAADVQILSDPDHANFRVFNQTSDFTQESVTSYHHNSIGGYHPAKLGLYQDIIQYQLSKGNMQVFNMLNTKYFISADQTGRPIAQLNPGAFGNCWLVKGIKFVTTANEEMLALDSTNLKDTAVVNMAYKKDIKELPQYDSLASISLKERLNDKITYTFTASSPQFATFSEVYYDKGWNAYIDDKKTDYAKVNYILRGLYVPAGKHDITFKFEPRSFLLGRTITIWSTVIIYLLLIATIGFCFIKKAINNA